MRATRASCLTTIRQTDGVVPALEVGSQSSVGSQGSAVLFFVLIGNWLQPSGFTQDVERTQGIVSGQDAILQALGIITIHNLTIMLRTDEASGVRGSPRRRRPCAARRADFLSEPAAPRRSKE